METPASELEKVGGEGAGRRFRVIPGGKVQARSAAEVLARLRAALR